jgi:hypothetical protein
VRLGTTIPALIYIGDGFPLCPCTVLDVSQGGGRIRLDAKSPVPDHFDLLFTKGARCGGRAAWSGAKTAISASRSPGGSITPKRL